MAKRTFVYGAAILLAANLFNRILGFIYQYLIMSYIGGEAYGLFNMVFPVYMTALVLTTAGIPLAVAKLVSEEISLGHRTQAKAIFRLALGILTISGTVVAFLLYLLTPVLVNRIFPDPRVLNIFRICVPAIFVVSVSSAFRGYFQGLQNMIPTAVSQIFEQITRVTIGFTGALSFSARGVEWSAAGLALGMLSGEIIGLMVIIFQYQKSKKNLPTSGESIPPLQHTLHRLWRLSSPVTLGRLMSSGLSALDAMLIPTRLQVAGYSAREATTLFGQLGGSAFTLLTFPSVFTFALATSLVPAISEAAARKQYQTVRSRSSEAIRLTIILGLPCLIILFNFADPLTSFFKSPNVGPILRVLALGGIFAYLQQTTTGILQGLGKVHLPVLISIVGAGVRVPLLFILTGIPQWGLRGSAWAYMLGWVTMASLNMLSIIRYSGMALDLQHFVLQPLTAGFGMAITFRFLSPLDWGYSASLQKLTAGLIVYAVILVLNGAITRSDLRRIPWLGKYLPLK